MADTFAELQENGATSGLRCRRCGEPATHGVSMRVTTLEGKKGGNPSIARANSKLCEECAVAVYEATAKALR